MNLKHEKLWGLSCIENSVLMYLKRELKDISWLYADSQIGLKDLFMCIFKEGQTVENFTGFPQIHNKLEKAGVLSIEKNISETVKLEDNPNLIYLVKMKPEFFETNKIQLWSGVYINVEKSERKLLFKDRFFEKCIDEGYLKEFYDGEYLVIKKNRNLNNDDKRLFGRQHQCTEMVKSWKELYFSEMERMPNILMKLKELIEIYRISKMREQAYRKDCCRYEEIDRLLIVTSYFCKYSANKKDIQQIIKWLWEIDERISEENQLKSLYILDNSEEFSKYLKIKFSEEFSILENNVFGENFVKKFVYKCN